MRRLGRGPACQLRNGAQVVASTKKDALKMIGQQASRPRSRVLTRRHVSHGALGLAAASLLAVVGIGHRGARASGVVAGAGLTELATYHGWRTSWDIIVPVLTQSTFPRTFLLYDRAAGDASLLAVDQFGAVGEIRAFTDWRATWDRIVSSPFPGVVGVQGLVAYDSSAGQVGIFEIDLFGNFQELRTYSNWRRSWTALIAFGTDGLLVYDRAAGYATIFNIDSVGSLRELRSYNDWRQSWDILTAGPFTTGQLPGRDILLYDRTARQAAGLTVGTSGDVTRFAEYAGWRTTWTSLAGGLFLLRGTAGNATADLLLFDQQAQQIEFLDIGAGNAPTSLLLAASPGAGQWTQVVPLGPDLILFYNRTAGTAAFYVTNRAPIPVPTSTAVPPTPTPAPPTVTPVPPATGRVTVRLQQGRGNDRDTYTGKTTAPAGASRRNALITGVKNTTDRRVSLIHLDRTGKRKGPEFVKAGEVSSTFNGMRVDGDWQAKVSGSLDDAPPRVTIEVRYEIR
jgi:hypothetical protein